MAFSSPTTIYLATRDGMLRWRLENVTDVTRADAVFYDGANYRDTFRGRAWSNPMVTTVEVVDPRSPDDGTTTNTGSAGGVPADYSLKTRLSDEVSHTPPRHKARQATMLTFVISGVTASPRYIESEIVWSNIAFPEPL